MLCCVQREGIDDVDKEIVDIISKRIELVKKIGEFKKEQDLTTFQVDRWNESLATITRGGG